MTDAAAMLASIRAAPDDDAPRLIYADWLEEHGQPELGEFIRVQCKLARTDSPALRQRESELLAEHHDLLAGALAERGFRYHFRRGFIVGFGHSGVFVQIAGWKPQSAMLRFFSNGMVMRSVDQPGEARTAECFEDSYPFLRKGRYILDTFAELSNLRFDFGIRSWQEVGVLDGTSLTITSSRRGSQVRRLSKYTHVHLAGFDSFPET